MTKTAFRIIACVLALIFVCGTLSACSKTVKDAELRCPMATEPVSVDPQTAADSESMTIAANCYEGLMKTDSDGKIVPAAAKSVASPDGMTYIFRLHEDKKWHINSNHEEIFGEGYETAIDLRVTAHDFVFGLQRALDPNTKAEQAYRLFMIKNAAKVNSGELPVSSLGVTALDDYTVQIQLEYASNEFMQILAEPIAAPCNRAFFEATKGRYGLNAESVLCNGPFYLSRWYKGSNILLRRNIDNPQAQALVYSVTYAFTQDSEIILNNLLENDYAVAPLTASQVQTAKDEGCDVKEIKNTVWGMLFNCSDSMMKSTKLRLALAKSVRFDEIRSASSDMSGSASGIIPPSCTIDGKAYGEVAPSLGALKYDTATAKKYFDEYTQGKECSFSILCTEEYETAVRRIIQSWQQLFGITLSARVEAVTADELDKRVSAGSYQCAFAPITTDAQTAVEFLYSFRGGANVCRYSSGNFNKLLSQLLSAGTPESVASGCMAAQKHLLENAVICPLFYQSRFIATNPLITEANILHSGNVITLHNTELLKD